MVAISLALLALRRRWPAGLAVWVYYGIIARPREPGIVHAGHQLDERPVQLPVLPGLGAARGSGRRADGIRGRRGHGALPWLARATPPSAAAWILALGDPHLVSEYKYGGTPRRCGATPSNPIRSARSVRTMSASLCYRQHLLRARQGQVRAGPGPAAGPRAGARRSRPRATRAWVTSTAAMSPLPHRAGRLAQRPRDPHQHGRRAPDAEAPFAEAMPYLERAYAIDADYVPGLVNLGARAHRRPDSPTRGSRT